MDLSYKKLGTPFPNDRNAVSFSLPEWNDVIDYELGKQRVIDAIKTGYPRFILHPDVQILTKLYKEKFATNNQECIILINKEAAYYGRDYLNKLSPHNNCVVKQYNGLFLLMYNSELSKEVKSFWQYSGYGISSRQAHNIIHNKNNYSGYNKKNECKIKQRIAEIVSTDSNNVFLFPSGMAAIYSAHFIVKSIIPDAKTIQLGFPYVDTLKIQENFGYGTHFVNNNLAKLEEIIKSETISAVFCEFPSNPLLKTVNIEKLHTILSKHNIPLIADDTIGTFYNIDIMPYADIIATSLTKFFSGTGNVLSGSLIINPKSSIYNESINLINEKFSQTSYWEDLEVLEKNSIDFIDRIQKINLTAEKICDFLNSHKEVESIQFPKYIDNENYNLIKRDNGGYGGLFSLILKDKDFAQTVYNKLTIAKGPSLGTNFTLCCPYTLLAHFDELEWAEKNGIPPHLIRVSIGLENYEELLHVFENSLKR